MPAKMGSPANIRVLLWVSDLSLENDLVATLQSEGCEVMLVPDCAQALDIMGAGCVDVLVLESSVHPGQIPRLATHLRFGKRRFQTLVLAGSIEQLALASETQADAVLMKPASSSQVRTVIRMLLAERLCPETCRYSELQAAIPDVDINE